MITTTILIQEMNTTMMMMICTMMTIMTTMIKEVYFIRCFLRSKEYKFINTSLVLETLGWTRSGPPWTRSGPPWTRSGPTWTRTGPTPKYFFEISANIFLPKILF